MAGRRRTRIGEVIEPCEGVSPGRDGTRCQTIPLYGWRYCPYHSAKRSEGLANEWGNDLERGAIKGVPADILLPPLGKPIDELNREELNALGRLVARQLSGDMLPQSDNEIKARSTAAF